MIEANETFGGTFPFKANYSTAPGFRMHYVDEGQGEPIVCLHGEPTWGYLYRKFISSLAQTHRVIVPDHMGFGKSETPQDADYTFSTHTENLEALLLELDLRDITLVIQDWGGPIGGAFALRNPERIKRLFMMNTMLMTGSAGVEELMAGHGDSDWFQWVARAAQDGSLEQVLGNLDVNILSILKLIGFQNMAAVTPDWLAAYSAPFAGHGECKGAIMFPMDLITGRFAEFVPADDSALDAIRAKPAMLAEGMHDRALNPAAVIADFKRIFPEAPVVELANAGHFCQEDEPELLVALIQQFIALTAND